MKNDNDSKVSLAQALQDMKMEQGESFDLANVNLAELKRRCGISRAKLRRLKSNNFNDKHNINIFFISIFLKTYI